MAKSKRQAQKHAALVQDTQQVLRDIVARYAPPAQYCADVLLPGREGAIHMGSAVFVRLLTHPELTAREGVSDASP